MIRESMIPDLAIDVDAEAVVVRAERPLRAVSSAIVGGGLVQARAIVNLHVAKGFRCAHSEGLLAEFGRRRLIPSPFVGLLTGAATDKAERAFERREALSVSAIVTVGLSNRSAAGRSAPAVWRPSTGYWYILQSHDGSTRSVQWGTAGDIPVPAYYRR